ncbi:MAG: hypothetical protein ACK5LY_02910 [Lachnospirales bacterium]
MVNIQNKVEKAYLIISCIVYTLICGILDFFILKCVDPYYSVDKEIFQKNYKLVFDFYNFFQIFLIGVFITFLITSYFGIRKNFKSKSMWIIAILSIIYIVLLFFDCSMDGWSFVYFRYL